MSYDLLQDLQNHYKAVPLQLQLVTLFEFEPKHYYPPYEWLSIHEEWTVRDALLLLVGLSPRETEIEKDSVTGTLEFIKVSFLINEFSARIFKDHYLDDIFSQYELLKKQVPKEDLKIFDTYPHSFNLYEMCSASQGYYQTAETLAYIENTRTIINQLCVFWFGRSDTKSKIKKELGRKHPIETYLTWIYEKQLTAFVPWWNKALAEGLIDEQGRIVRDKEAATNNDKGELSNVERDNLHRIIGVFADIITGKIHKNEDFSSAAKLVNYLDENYGELSGLSKSNVEKVLAKANRLKSEKGY